MVRQQDHHQAQQTDRFCPWIAALKVPRAVGPNAAVGVSSEVFSGSLLTLLSLVSDPSADDVGIVNIPQGKESR